MKRKKIVGKLRALSVPMKKIVAASHNIKYNHQRPRVDYDNDLCLWLVEIPNWGLPLFQGKHNCALEIAGLLYLLAAKENKV